MRTIEDMVIPQERRKALNEKCFAISTGSDPNGITRDEVAAVYSGEGALHGLKFVDFDNYARYKEGKQEIEQGSFFTPYSISKWISEIFPPRAEDALLDLTCGKGSLFEYVQYPENCTGIELNFKSYSIAKFLYPTATIENADIQYYNTTKKYDLSYLNPPFHLNFVGGVSSEMFTINKAVSFLKPGGFMAVIVPESFLSDPYMDDGKAASLNTELRHIVSVRLPKNTFQYAHGFQTKCLFFQKRAECLEEKPYTYDTLEFQDSAAIFTGYTEAYMQDRDRLKARLYLESKATVDDAFLKKTEKLLFDIKSNPTARKLLMKSQHMLDAFLNQEKPIGMSFKDWQSISIKKEDVLAFLKKALRSQNAKVLPAKQLVKYKNTLIYRYGETWSESDEWDINQLVKEEAPNVPEQRFARLIRKKRNALMNELMPTVDVVPDPLLLQEISELHFVDKKGVPIVLNAVQLRDIGVCLGRNACVLSWEQGAGKTLASAAVAIIRMNRNQSQNAIVLGPAIAIELTWEDFLIRQHLPFVRIRKASDYERVKPKDFILITYELLNRTKRFMKRFLRLRSRKAQVILDEADNLANLDSTRTKASEACFRRVKKILPTTGTLTRNSISEFFPIFEIMYNNSAAMICDAEQVWSNDKDGHLVTERNLAVGKPFPAYKKGLALFQASFSPEHLTVFGVGQRNQDLYNGDILHDIVARTSIVRTLEEVAGRKLCEMSQNTAMMNAEEEKIYLVAIEEFYKMEGYFNKTGDARKDAMLRILNQLILMLRICAAANQFGEYQTEAVPEKMLSVMKLIDNNPDEYVCVGVRHIAVAKLYAEAIQKAFPLREVFLVTGQMPLKKRKQLIEGAYKASKNGILVSTQQSLSASLDIEYVNVCLIAELHYNQAAMSQFSGRFVRFTSKQMTKVIYCTYKDSIEENLLMLILSKEKTNLYMKGQDLEMDEIYETFGIEPDMLQNLLYKEKDEQGNVKIRWGSQTIRAAS